MEKENHAIINPTTTTTNTIRNNSGSEEAKKMELNEDLPEILPPEVEEGNIEYKRKLVNPSELRLEHLITQLKYRLQEGKGEALYEIGVEDCGVLAGLEDEEMKASLHTIRNMAARLGASMTVLREKLLDGCKRKKVVEVLVRKIQPDHQLVDLRVAVVGNVDSGKSTILGVLTQGELDNGRGRARLNLFRHLHEIQSGRTSSISHEIIGFSTNDEVINYSDSRTVEDIVDSSCKIISFIDLCGHHKYLKTTIFGLTGYSPDYAMLVVSANTGLVGTTKEHLGYALALRLPAFIVINKVDMCRANQLERTISQLERLIQGPGCSKAPIRVECESDAVSSAANFSSGRICPILIVSCVTGQNLHLLLKFFQNLPHVQHDRQLLAKELTEFQIDEVYSISGIGQIVGGTLLRGCLKEGDQLVVGPSQHGLFSKVKVLSLHKNRLPCTSVQSGQTACISVGNFDEFNLRRGQVLLSPLKNARASFEFEADIVVLYHNKTICRGFQTVVHVGNVRQTARIIKMNKGGIQMNEKAVVTFRFINRPEYIRIGSRLLFREGRTKGMGEVMKVF